VIIDLVDHNFSVIGIFNKDCIKGFITDPGIILYSQFDFFRRGKCWITPVREGKTRVWNRLDRYGNILIIISLPGKFINQHSVYLDNAHTLGFLNSKHNRRRINIKPLDQLIPHMLGTVLKPASCHIQIELPARFVRPPPPAYLTGNLRSDRRCELIVAA